MKKQEIWKPIPNYEGIYEASNKGRIRTCKNKETYTDFHGTRHWKQRILKPKGQTYATGYRVSLWKDGKRKDWLVARLIGITFLGESNLTINHIDGNRFNNNVENLEWISLAENIKKGFEIGLYHCQKQVEIVNKNTKEIKRFRSLAQASYYMKRNKGYISLCISRNKTENKEYAWKLIEENEKGKL